MEAARELIPRGNIVQVSMDESRPEGVGLAFWALKLTIWLEL